MPLFRIHVERIDGQADAAGPGASTGPDAVTFEAKNHDDILSIARRMQSRPGLEPEEGLALGVGLKLFSEVLLKHRKESPFAELQPHLREFIGALKGQNTAAPANS